MNSFYIASMDDNSCHSPGQTFSSWALQPLPELTDLTDPFDSVLQSGNNVTEPGNTDLDFLKKDDEADSAPNEVSPPSKNTQQPTPQQGLEDIEEDAAMPDIPIVAAEDIADTALQAIPAPSPPAVAAPVPAVAPPEDVDQGQLPVTQSYALVPQQQLDYLHHTVSQYMALLLSIDGNVRNVTPSGQLFVDNRAPLPPYDWRSLFMASIRQFFLFQDTQDQAHSDWFSSREIEVITTSVYKFLIAVELQDGFAQQAASCLAAAIRNRQCTISLWREETKMSNLQVLEIDPNCVSVFAVNDMVMIQLEGVKITASSDKHDNARFFFQVLSVENIPGLVNIINAPVLVSTKNASILTVSKKHPSPKLFPQRKIAAKEKRPQELQAAITNLTRHLPQTPN